MRATTSELQSWIPHEKAATEEVWSDCLDLRPNLIAKSQLAKCCYSKHNTRHYNMSVTLCYHNATWHTLLKLSTLIIHPVCMKNHRGWRVASFFFLFAWCRCIFIWTPFIIHNQLQCHFGFVACMCRECFPALKHRHWCFLKSNEAATVVGVMMRIVFMYIQLGGGLKLPDSPGKVSCSRQGWGFKNTFSYFIKLECRNGFLWAFLITFWHFY